MLDALKFVQGAVAKKEIVAGLTHFKIKDGTVRSYNGVFSLCSPIPLDFDCTPKAEPMVKAILACNDAVQLLMTPAGRLSIKSGGFSAFIQCIEEETPHVEPEGEIVEINGEDFMQAFATLLPFVGTDAHRPFCTGLLLKGQCAYATNNVVAIEHWVGKEFPIEANIPGAAIRELLRIKKMPTHIQHNDKSLTFHYEDGRWLRTGLLTNDWPSIPKLFDAEHKTKDIDPSMFDAIENIKPFCDKTGRVYLENGTVRTHYETTEGASHVMHDMSTFGVYNSDMLLLLKGVAKKIDMSTYPAPSIFYGDKLRGVIIGWKI